MPRRAERGASAPSAIPNLASPTAVKPVTRVRLTDVQSGMAQAVMIVDNDTINVPKAQTIFVTGQVRTPGAYRYDDEMTVFTAIALAGGVGEKGSNSRISIVRFTNGQRKEFAAKFSDVLQPGDNVVVKNRRL